MPFFNRIPRLTLRGLFATVTIIVVALALYSAYDRFALLLLSAILAAIAFPGIVWPRRWLSNRFSVACGILSSVLAIYLICVVPAVWIVARMHTLDVSRPQYVTAFQCVFNPAAECWIDSPKVIRTAFLRVLEYGLPSSATLEDYPCGFGYTTKSANGGAGTVVLANYYRG